MVGEKLLIRAQPLSDRANQLIDSPRACIGLLLRFPDLKSFVGALLYVRSHTSSVDNDLVAGMGTSLLPSDILICSLLPSFIFNPCTEYGQIVHVTAYQPYRDVL